MLILLFIIPILCFLALEAFFSGSETAIISANKMRLKALADRGDKRAVLANRLLKSPGRLLGTTLVGTNVSVATGTTLASVMVSSLLQRLFGADMLDLESSITTLMMSPLILIFGEIIPKSICRAKANSIALAVSPLLRWASIVLYPLVSFITRITSYLASLLSRQNRSDRTTVIEELKLLARLSEKEGLLRPHQRKMLYSVFDLSRQTVGQAMVPLVDVVSIEKNTSLERFHKKVVETRFSRYPVFEDRVDNIVGIVNVMDVLYSDDSFADIRSFIREDVLYFPESKHINTSLRELQHSKYPMAIVVDEYGGVSGIVTMKDLAEEIVGKIQNEWETGFDESKLECDGRTEIDDINERLGTDIPKNGYETIAGFLIKQMDGIPKTGDEVKWKNLRIIVLRADKRSVSRVKFIKGERNE